MARSLNQVTLLGNITRDPQLRRLPSGQVVVTVSLALNRTFKSKDGEWQEATDYVDVTAWGPLAERVVQFLSKGSKCLVQGRLQSLSWQDDTGKRRTKVEVLAADVTFLDQRKKNEYDQTQDDVITDVGDEPVNLDDIPF